MSEEAKVKRYTTHVTGLLVVHPDARSTYNENWTDVVLASDFDALARQLEEARASERRMREVLCNVQHGHFCPAQPRWLESGFRLSIKLVDRKAVTT